MTLKYTIQLIFLVIFGIFIVGCGSNAPKPLYQWDGSYTQSVYQYLNQEGDPNEQILHLENLIQKSYKNQRKVPPGLYAQLALLYSSIGNEEKTNMYLLEEAKAFPESKAYIEFLQKMKKKTKNEK